MRAAAPEGKLGGPREPLVFWPAGQNWPTTDLIHYKSSSLVGHQPKVLYLYLLSVSMAQSSRSELSLRVEPGPDSRSGFKWSLNRADYGHVSTQQNWDDTLPDDLTSMLVFGSIISIDGII
ncbi:hypothetical protein EPI10_004170 [Gossypium australe]|uniref:Uncharacterized protein n=1 Tax=Gossypium australe TaxID=47621 RepID=A0A5B6UKY9_9ROSI|nr:hypothetical protein EPI10_004170 [Gossypium australe]